MSLADRLAEVTMTADELGQCRNGNEHAWKQYSPDPSYTVCVRCQAVRPKDKPTPAAREPVGDDEYSRGHADGIRAAADLNVKKVVHEVELGSTTLRALYEVLYEVGMLSDTQRMTMLAALDKEKP